MADGDQYDPSIQPALTIGGQIHPLILQAIRNRLVNAARGTLAGAQAAGQGFLQQTVGPFAEAWRRGYAGDVPSVQEQIPGAVNTALLTMGRSPFVRAPVTLLDAGALYGQRGRPEAFGRGEPGGDPGLAQAQRAAAAASGGIAPIEGLPRGPFIGADAQPYIPGPIADIHAAAQDYVRQAGLPYQPLQTYAKLDKARAARIAKAHEDLPHAPEDPATAAAYNAMIRETLGQYQALANRGYKFEFIKPGMEDPYAASPRLAAQDFRDNKHLWVFPTDLGFGAKDAASQEAMRNNPMLQPSGITIDGRPTLNNDLFRIVHDVFGHFQHGFGFRAEGEENAWRSHSRMYSPQARPAMTGETRGQNSWVNYGPYGEANRKASAADTVYAPSKTVIMPDWAVTEGAEDPPRGLLGY